MGVSLLNFLCMQKKCSCCISSGLDETELPLRGSETSSRAKLEKNLPGEVHWIIYGWDVNKLNSNWFALCIHSDLTVS